MYLIPFKLSILIELMLQYHLMDIVSKVLASTLYSSAIFFIIYNMVVIKKGEVKGDDSPLPELKYPPPRSFFIRL